MTCCVPRCSLGNVDSLGSDINFHEFPCDPNIAAKWIRNINVSMPNGGKWYPKPEEKVCSNHFLPSDFRLGAKRNVLKPGSIPTVFESAAPNPTIPLILSRSNKRKRDPSPTSPLIVKVGKREEAVSTPKAISTPNTPKINSPRFILPNCATAIGKNVFIVPSHLLPQGVSPVSACIIPQGTAAPQLTSPISSASPLLAKPAVSSTSPKVSSSSPAVISPGASSTPSLSPKVGQQPRVIPKPVSTVVGTNSSSNAHVSTSLLKTNTKTINTAPRNLVRPAVPNSSPASKSTNVATKPKATLAPVKPVTQNQSSEPQMDLIEIGPSTFLKINPDVIKVTKKVTPTGNTVLQFVMNPNITGAFDPKTVFQTGTRVNSKKPPLPKPVLNKNKQGSNKVHQEGSVNLSNTTSVTRDTSNGSTKAEGVSSTANLDDNDIGSLIAEPDTTSQNGDVSTELDDPVVLVPSNFPVQYQMQINLWNAKQQKCIKAIREKTHTIKLLRTKICKMNKKVEDLENRCIVQERQLNFASVKKLKAIKKNAENGEPHATFILEQIRGYFQNVPLRWSPTTMNQCTVWCRKAPYAYEYFKKADLFRLPAMATVKRYMKSHPEITTQIKNRTLGVHTFDSDESSSDFDFDESEDEAFGNDGEQQGMASDYVPCETVLDETQDGGKGSRRSRYNESSQQGQSMYQHIDAEGYVLPDSNSVREEIATENDTNNEQGENTEIVQSEEQIHANVNGYTENSEAVVVDSAKGSVEEVHGAVEHETVEKIGEVDGSPKETVSEEATENVATLDYESQAICLPATTLEGGVTTVNLNGQELILQPGSNVIQLNSELGSDGQFENQYIVIPAADDQTESADHQYTAGQPISLVIQNNDEDGQQIIYITDASNVAENVSVSLGS